MHLSKLWQKGETIIEVLIAIVVISSILSGGFVVSNQSRNKLQSNQERYQAQLYLNQQAAFIHSYLTSNTSSGTRTALLILGNFCFADPTTTKANVSKTSVDAACQKDAQGFKVNIAVSTSPSNGPTYTVFDITVIWDSVANRGTDNVELIYGT